MKLNAAIFLALTVCGVFGTSQHVHVLTDVYPKFKCPGECAKGLGSDGCPTCACKGNSTNKENATCPEFTCPGECSLAVSIHGCQLCDCPSGTTIGAGLDIKLGETCLSNIDCAAAYSTCKSNKCTCIDGFKSNKGVCTPPALQCPTWKGQSKSDPGKSCEHHVNQSTGDESHTCDKQKEFCFIHPKEHGENGRNVGHCCPKPPKKVEGLKLVCPFKGSEDNGTCPDFLGWILAHFPADAPVPNDQARTCSHVSHDCIRHFNESVCCPLPCIGASSHFSVHGQCLDYVEIGNDCKNDAVCIGGSHCVALEPGQSWCLCPKQTCYEPSSHCCDE